MTEIILGIVILAGFGLIEFGDRLIAGELQKGRSELDAQREALRTEWQTLEHTRRVNDVYFAAGDELRRAEANSQLPPWPFVFDGGLDEQGAPWGGWSR
jgi:hypothetical protein